MLKLNHITLEKEGQEHLIEDVSFCFSDKGFISMHGDDEDMLLQLARLLSGFSKPACGTLEYQDTVIEQFSEDELCRYRTSCTASLFCDFQLLEQRSVLDNIHLTSQVDEQELDELLKQWGLYGKKETWIEDLDFDDHIRMVLLRILLRHPQILIVYPPSSPFSAREWGRMYPLLKKLSSELLVIVIQDKNSYTWSDRIIEFEAGYVISDSCGKGAVKEAGFVQAVDFHMEPAMEKRILTRLHHRFRLKYLLLMLLHLTAFVLVSTAVFSTTLDVTEIEMLYLKQNNLTSIAVEKHATGTSGDIYEKKYVPMQDSDLKALQKELHGDVFAGYVPVNTSIATQISYLTSADNYAVIEMKHSEMAGLQNLYGHYPENVYETAITYQTALDLFSATEGVQAPEFYLYQTVSWYGLPLTVTGIIDEKQSNSNLSLNMTGYAGSTREASSLNSRSLYVYPGFHKHHSMQEQQAFVPSHKRFIDSLTLRSYEVGNIYPIPYANAYYFYDGKQLHLDNDGNNESMVKEDEVLLDFSMALKLGYQSRYIQGFRDGGVSWDMREADYCSFIKNWIGKTIQVQAYAIDTAPDDSTLMKKNVTIKGFLFPITWEFDENYVKSEGSILMNKHAVADSMQPNSMIQSVYFHTEKEADMRGALQYLRQHPTYSAFFSRSRLLQFFVVDLKKMSFLLFMSGGCAMLLSITLLIHLLNLIMEDGKKEMSIYYMFGEHMHVLKQFYEQHMSTLLRKHTIAGCLMATLVVAVFVGMIYLKLSADISILLSLFLPLLVAAAYLLCMIFLIHQLVKRKCIVEELFCDEETRKV
ncbi:hypothetical protein MKA58_08200 [[Clostridium] innocuum]|nr:hypothetical protein [[Clostridium] innocuum]